MHDPNTLALDIYLGKKENKKGHYRTPLISIWHHDPEKHGDEDSCGWFIRSRHIDPKLIDKVTKEFAFNFKHNYWFDVDGKPKLSTIAIVVNMYTTAAWQIFMFQNNGKPDRKRQNKFMRKYLYDIIYFAENECDSLNSSIDMRHGFESVDSRISNFTNIITADIFRKIRPLYKHPKWHIHHWQITFPIFRELYRRYIERCDRCRVRFKNQSIYGNWGGTEHWCEKCNGSSCASVKNEEGSR